jgi:hypothetical protein
MAAFQFGHIDSAWDPFFGSGTERILDSDVSHAWPISDAGLGAAVYMLEALMGLMGDQRRWRTMPWMVTFFAILVVPLGITSIVLVILQPLAVGTWCTLCLAAALAMLVMIPLTLDEVVAMTQFLVQSHHEGNSAWRAFWLGGTVEGSMEDQRSPATDLPSRTTVPAMFWGMTVPWPLLLSTALGIWLMFAPDIFGSRGAAADSDHLFGALVVVFAMIAWAEVARPVRFLNALPGAWLIVAPWLLGGTTTGSIVNDMLAGVTLVLLSAPLGSVRETYGTWSEYLTWSAANPAPAREEAHVGHQRPARNRKAKGPG